MDFNKLALLVEPKALRSLVEQADSGKEFRNELKVPGPLGRVRRSQRKATETTIVLERDVKASTKRRDTPPRRVDL